MMLLTALWLGDCSNANFSRGGKSQTTTDASTNGTPDGGSSSTTGNVDSGSSPVCQQKLAIVLALDVSDSMKDLDTTTPATTTSTAAASAGQKKIDLSMAAAKDFVGLFKDKGDLLGLVTFSTDVNTTIPLSSNTDAMLAAIGQMTPGGFTNIAGALQHAGGLMGDAGITDNTSFKRIIIVMSDGEQTVYQDGLPIPVATQMKTAGMEIATLGYALGGDTSVMQSIASQPDLYYDAKDGSSLIAGFHKLLDGLCAP